MCVIDIVVVREDASQVALSDACCCFCSGPEMDEMALAAAGAPENAVFIGANPFLEVSAHAQSRVTEADATSVT